MRFLAVFFVLFASILFSRNPDFIFVIYGDNGAMPVHKNSIVPLILKQKPKFVINTGDMAKGPEDVDFAFAYPENRADWNDLLDQIRPITDAGIAYFPTLGNHDVSRADVQGSHPINSPTVAIYRSIWDSILAPQASEYKIKMGTYKSLWYTFEYNDWHFIDRNTFHVNEANPWFKANLEDFKARNLNFVVLQQDAMFEMNSSNCDNLGSSYVIKRKGWGYRKSLNEHDDLFLKNNVKLVFEGDIHYFHRITQDGIMYVNTSGGGRPLRTANPDCFFPEKGDLYFSDYHILRADVYGKGIVFSAIDIQETVRHTWVYGDTTSSVGIAGPGNNKIIAKNLITSYPNPINAEVKIQFPEVELPGATLTIFSISGKPVFQENLFKGQTILNWKPHNLPNGHYVIHFKEYKKIFTEKIFLLN